METRKNQRAKASTQRLRKWQHYFGEKGLPLTSPRPHQKTFLITTSTPRAESLDLGGFPLLMSMLMYIIHMPLSLLLLLFLAFTTFRGHLHWYFLHLFIRFLKWSKGKKKKFLIDLDVHAFFFFIYLFFVFNNLEVELSFVTLIR